MGEAEINIFVRSRMFLFFFCVVGIYFHEPEITPSGSQGVFRFDKNGTQVLKPFPPEVEVRAVIEGQFLAKLSHARKLGYEISASSRVLATGGASTNTGILQVSGNVVFVCVASIICMAHS